MSGLVKRVILMVVLSCLIPTSATLTSEECEIAVTSVSVTCGVTAAITGLLSVFICVGTLGVGCATIVPLIGAATAVCGTATDAASCSGNEMEQVISLLHDIKQDVEDLSNDIDLGFYQQSFGNDIEIIQNAVESYQTNVVLSSMDPDLTRGWMDQMRLHYHVENALMEIEDMIEGEREGLTPLPSIYKIARENGLCSPELYQFVFELITEGTIVHLIYLKNGGLDDIPQYMTDQLKTRVLLNDRMYDTYCRLNIPIEAFRIKVSDRSYASTSGNLQIGVKQGDQNSCQTVVETFTSPQTNVLYLRDNKSLYFGSCVNTWFQHSYNMPLQIRVLSDSGNDSYLDKIGVKINGVWRDWVWGYQKKVNKNEGKEWQTVISAAAAIDNSGFTATQSATGHNGFASRAIDGNTDQNYNSNTCTHTVGDNPWWKLNLGASYSIFKIVIYNRVDSCCKDRIDGVKVFAIYGEIEAECGQVNYVDGVDVYEIQCYLETADHIKISQNSQAGAVSLCEVEVYGEPITGF